MLLANYNIQELVTEQINSYLAEDELSFTDYKAQILSKSPFPKVHSAIVTILNNSKKTDQIEVQKVLEKQACKNQLAEDEKQKKIDELAGIKDEALKERLVRELNHIPTLEVSYATEITLLKRRLLHLLESNTSVEVIQNQRTDINRIPVRIPTNNHARDIARFNKSILDYQTKAQGLIAQRKSSQLQLDKIDKRSEKRLANHLKRTKREQARVGYQTTGEGVLDTLSVKNRSLLAQGIQDQFSALEKKCAELLQESEQIHFAYFLEQIPNHLTSTKKLSETEIAALKSVLKLMKQHLLYEQEILSSQDSLTIKQHSINIQMSKLQELKTKHNILKKDNPSLTSANMQLITQNAALSASLEHNKSLHQRLGALSLLLLALTLVFTIPLILTLNGVIPFFIAPVLLYILVTAPPVLLLIATIALGISSIVYYSKSNSNEQEINKNKQTISKNTSQLDKNHISLQNLLLNTIPTLESQIKKDESLKEQIETSLQKTQVLSKQAVQQATEIEPLSYASSPFLEKARGEEKKRAVDKESVCVAEEKETEKVNTLY